MRREKRAVSKTVLGVSLSLAFIPAAANVARADDHPYNVPALHSRRGAAYTIYLDFAGFNYTGTWLGDTPGDTQAFDGVASTGSFNAAQQAQITEIWARVAQAYAPFDVNVTTIDPAFFAGKDDTDFDRQNYYDDTPRLMHTVIGNDDSSWLSGSPAGGVSRIGSTKYDSSNYYFGDHGIHTNWIFDLNLANTPQYIADAAEHENGHGFGLRHQSDFDSSGNLINEYSTNSGSPDIGPIMGAPYQAVRAAWAVGNADVGTADNPVEQTQNDVAVILNNPGLSRVQDGIGHTMASATPLFLTGNTIDYTRAKGVIVPDSQTNPSPDPGRTLSDYYSFYVANDNTPVTITANSGTDYITPGTADPGATADLSLWIYDPNGDLVGVANDSTLSETISLKLNQGLFHVQVGTVSGTFGTFANDDTYYNIGSYFLTGSGFSPFTATDAYWQPSWTFTNLNGSFVDGAHWTTAAAPDANVTAHYAIGSGSTYTVGFTGDAASKAVDVGAGDNATFDLGGHTYNYGTNLRVGDGATLSLLGGTLSGNEPDIGVGSAGTLNIGAGATLISQHPWNMYIGQDGGTGTVNLTSGGHLTTNWAMLADLSPNQNEDTAGTVNVDGDGSQWTIADVLYLSVNDSGVTATTTSNLSITNGGLVTTPNTWYGGDATINVDGRGSNLVPSTFNAGFAQAFGGDSTVTISNGGLMTFSQIDLGDNLGIGLRSQSGTQSIVVTGAGSQFNSTDATAVDYIGLNAPAALTIENGATAIGANEIIGDQASGTVNLTGAGSTWTVTSATLDSHGSVTVGSGAAFDVTNALTLNSGATLGNQGAVSAQSISLTSASLTSAGTTAIDGPAQTTGVNAADSISVDGAAAIWLAQSADIGANGVLNVTGGANVTFSDIFSTGNDNSIGLHGDITVDGADSPVGSPSTLTSGPIITYPGSSLTIKNGGVVNYLWYTLGQAAGTGTGTVTVTGAGSQFNSTSTGSTDYVGYMGASELDILDGATAVGANEVIGSGAAGSVVLNGVGSKWTVTSATVDSHGSVNIDGTTAIDVPTQTTGVNAADSVTVDGAGATWHAAGLNAGANGVLNVTGGGYATFSSIALSGQITVDGADSPVGSPSTLTSGPTITYPGSSLTIKNGGVENYLWYTLGQTTGTGTGVVTVTGAGSQFNSSSTSQTDYVGYMGASALNIEDGATVIGANERIGYQAPGTVMVDGAGSKWTITSATLDSHASLTTSNGGAVQDNGMLMLNTGATLANHGSIIAQSMNVLNGTFTADGTTEIDGGTFTAGNQSVGGSFINQGAVTGPTITGQQLTFSGDVSGGGSFAGNVAFEKSYTPDDPVTVALNGNTVFASTNTLTLDIAGLIQGTLYDHLDTSDTGLTTFGGTLAIDLIDGFSPRLGNSFDLFDGPTAGMFDNLDLDPLSSGLVWNTSQLYSTGVLSVVPEPTSLSLLALGAGGLLLRRRRRT